MEKIEDISTLIEDIMVQTTYNMETATNKLEQFGSVIDVVRDYCGIPTIPTQTKKSINQEIFRQIRRNTPIRKLNADHVMEAGK